MDALIPSVCEVFSPDGMAGVMPKFRSEFAVNLVDEMWREGVVDATQIQKRCALVGRP